MSYLVLARRYRPQTFDELVGQDHVARTLKNAISQGRLAHAYLFTGPRGVGKTSTARILAKSLNCEKGPTLTPCGVCAFCADIASGRSLDVVEIDGASNRGIDEIRELRENARYAASAGKKRIYIVDEVHMLTNEAWNALLKILEEPPPHVLFIFATTQPSKVLPTILSRCQRFDFRRIPTEKIVERLRSIAEKEGFTLTDEVFYLVARRADGGLRDAESLLDQIVSFAGKSASLDEAEDVLGVIGQEVFFDLAGAIAAKDAGAATKALGRALDGGADLLELSSSLLGHLRALFIVTCAESPGEILDASPETVGRLADQARLFARADLLRLARILAASDREMRRSSHARVLFELALLEMVSLDASVDLADLLERLDAAGLGEAAGAGSGARAPQGQRSAPRSAPASPGTPADRGGAPAPAPAAPPGPSATIRPASPARPGTPPAASAATAPIPERRAAVTAVAPAPAADASPRVPVAPAPASDAPPRAATAKIAAPAESTGPADAGSLPPRATLAIDAVRARWDEFLAGVAGSKRALAAFLGHASPIEVADGSLVLGFSEKDQFQSKQVEAQENRRALEAGLSDFFGERMRVVTRIVAGPAGAAPAGGGGASALLSHPAVQKAVALFDAEVVSRRSAPQVPPAGRSRPPAPAPDAAPADEGFGPGLFGDPQTDEPPPEP